MSCARAVTPHWFVCMGRTCTHKQIYYFFFTLMYSTHYNIIKVNENTSAGRQKTNEPQISYDTRILLLLLSCRVASVVVATAYNYTLHGYLHIPSPNLTTHRRRRCARSGPLQLLFFVASVFFFRNSKIKRSNRSFAH